MAEGRDSQGDRLGTGPLERFLSPLSLAAKKAARGRHAAIPAREGKNGRGLRIATSAQAPPRNDRTCSLVPMMKRRQTSSLIRRSAPPSPRGRQTPPPPPAVPVSLRLGHAAALTCHRHVIHYRGVASLPLSGEATRAAGRGFGRGLRIAAASDIGHWLRNDIERTFPLCIQTERRTGNPVRLLVTSFIPPPGSGSSTSPDRP